MNNLNESGPPRKRGRPPKRRRRPLREEDGAAFALCKVEVEERPEVVVQVEEAGESAVPVPHPVYSQQVIEDLPHPLPLLRRKKSPDLLGFDQELRSDATSCSCCLFRLGRDSPDTFTSYFIFSTS